MRRINEEPVTTAMDSPVGGTGWILRLMDEAGVQSDGRFRQQKTPLTQSPRSEF